jgi:hypothetical protein
MDLKIAPSHHYDAFRWQDPISTVGFENSTRHFCNWHSPAAAPTDKDVYPFKNDEAVEVTDEGENFIGSTNCQKHRSGSGKTIKK